MEMAVQKTSDLKGSEINYCLPGEYIRLHQDNRGSFYFIRPRMNNLFMEAIQYPLVVVCAGEGYGKTSAVHDFVQKYRAETAWIQLSERDNVRARFWENFTHSISQNDAPFAKALTKIGFPDTIDILNQYISLVRTHVGMKRRIIVMDDFHFIEDNSVIRFVECTFLNMGPGSSLFLISRSAPHINTAGLVSRGCIFNISEDDLRFTDDELAQYFRRLDMPLQPDNLREIMQDTGGWGFAINLIARSYRKAPGYGGYIRNAMKINIFRLMETEIWDGLSERLQFFLVRLSLIGHLSVDLIALLAETDKDLITELERQKAYVRRDSYINTYLIHPLFLEFLASKQDLLSGNQKRRTYEIAAEWCNRNDFKIDAMSYYEKIGDYEKIVSIFFKLPAQVPVDIANYAAGLFNKIPSELFDNVDYLAVMHIRAVMCLGLWQEASGLAEFYEAKYKKMPRDNSIRNHTLGGIYYYWGVLRTLMCTMDGRYDFDKYYTKLDCSLSESSVNDNPGRIANHPTGPWISLVGTARKGAPQEYIDALARAASNSPNCLKGAMTSTVELSRGELKFYQGDFRGAELFIARAIDHAREHRHFDIVHRALLYTLRIAVSQGNYHKMEQALKEIESQLNENEYSIRFITYDIALAVHYCFLYIPENIPDWLKDKFTPYGHANFIENFGNQAKARYCYLTKDYPPLLAYMEEQKQRESILYGRLEMLAMEACIHYKLKDKTKAFGVLSEAYEAAIPNGILTPFIELGKDMRSLTASALRETSHGIPEDWLEYINRKSTAFAKRQAHIVAEYKQAKGIADGLAFSPREAEILKDLSHGLSRMEIAVSRNLSVNTVKMFINNLYSKTGSENLADLIRIAVERKMM